MARLRDEVDAAVASRKMSCTASFDQIRQLPYLDACIRESFRLCPSTPLFPRFVDEPGIIYGKTTIPTGTEVAASPWITMRDPAMYGHDANCYRPERWIEAPPEQRQEWDRYDFHWGYGNRLCMGKHIAIMEIYMVAFQVSTPVNPFSPVWRASAYWNEHRDRNNADVMQLTCHFDLALVGTSRVVVRARDVLMD